MLLDKYEERVRRHAHRLWELEGKPHGRNDEFWSCALEEVKRIVEREATTRAEAHRLWQEAGKPFGTADRFWFEAEKSGQRG